ncbi:MAG: dephospho-CoA kinase [Weeksellaceae bacterium]|jgi:dephospho-CoA kinase|nr:dephospho-CoA kinase [Weeksellaceae bacterium]
MKTIGLTGGIGSGKSTLANWFLEKGIPVYNSDEQAKKLLNEDESLKNRLIAEFGIETYKNGVYNRNYISSIVFKKPEALKKLNKIVHPAVFRHFNKWLNEQKADYVVKEAAILFESGSWKDCDAIISVVADVEIRIRRVMNRDQVSAQQVKNRIKNQWTDEQRIEKSNFIVHNNGGINEFKQEFEKLFLELQQQYCSK